MNGGGGTIHLNFSAVGEKAIEEGMHHLAGGAALAQGVPDGAPCALRVHGRAGRRAYYVSLIIGMGTQGFFAVASPAKGGGLKIHSRGSGWSHPSHSVCAVSKISYGTPAIVLCYTRYCPLWDGSLFFAPLPLRPATIGFRN